jgi:vitamin B12 transporter
MKRTCLIAAVVVPLGAHAQLASPLTKATFDPILVTATRTIDPEPTLRDSVVITRDDLDDAGNLSLGEVLQRHAGVELGALGGPGQPQSIFIRGAGSANTLVLIDGVRMNTATSGIASIQAIPLDMIERIEVVKGPMSSLYGSEAAGGVIQIFTRGKTVPYFFASAAAGTDRDFSASTGLTTSDDTNLVTLNMGARTVDARSATNARNTFSFDPDRDAHRMAFANVRASHRFWQGETIVLEAFGSYARTRFDAGIPPPGVDDYTNQSLGGWRVTSSNQMMQGWKSALGIGESIDDLKYHGQFADHYRTRQDQVSWINQFGAAPSSATLGYERVRQVVTPDVASDGTVLYTRNSRTTDSFFGSVAQAAAGQHVEASARRDDDLFGARNTGSVSYGIDLGTFAQVAGTYGRGFRAPTFNDLYFNYIGYSANPDLRPERSHSREISLRSAAGSAMRWHVTAFDNRFQDLIVYALTMPVNVARARIRGVEASVEAAWREIHFRGSLTLQRPRDEDSGARLQRRAERFASLDASRTWGRWTAGLSLLASGDRFDSVNEDPGTHLPGYAVVDARVRYAITPKWTAEVVATNLGDRRYETAFGYDAPRRGVLLNIRFASY